MKGVRLMEDKLKHLRESMDKTVFKDTSLESYERTKILNGLNRNERKVHFNLNSILSFAVCTFLFIGIGALVFNEVKDRENNKPQSNTALDTSKEEKHQVQNEDQLETKSIKPYYPYIVLDGYYYKKTNEVIQPEGLGEQIAEVKRIGDWEFKKSGDSNEIPPGPIYSVKGKDTKEYIAGKGIIYKEGKNQAGYIVFKKEELVEQPKKESILNSKGDLEEVQIAFGNIIEKVEDLHHFIGIEKRVNLYAADYLPENGPGVDLVYNVPEANIKDNEQNIDGMLFIREYQKDLPPPNSRFLPQNGWNRIKKGNEVIKQKEFIPPSLIKSFEINGISWGYYEDKTHQDFILRGERNNMYFEVVTQGDFSFEKLKELLKKFKQVR